MDCVKKGMAAVRRVINGPSRDQGVYKRVAVARIVPREVDGTAATTERYLGPPDHLYGSRSAKLRRLSWIAMTEITRILIRIEDSD